jgi:hypothetical protein
MSQEEKEKKKLFFDIRLTDESRKKEIEIERIKGEPGEGVAKFTIKALLPKDYNAVDLMVARRLYGVDRRSMNPTAIKSIEISEELRASLIEYPSWWDGPDECPDDEFLIRLYEMCDKHSTEFRESLKKNRSS